MAPGWDNPENIQITKASDLRLIEPGIVPGVGPYMPVPTNPWADGMEVRELNPNIGLGIGAVLGLGLFAIIQMDMADEVGPTKNQILGAQKKPPTDSKPIDKMPETTVHQETNVQVKVQTTTQ